MTETVRTHVASLRTDACLIPGGLTSHLQPADISWNKPFKSAYRDLYNEWMSSGEKSFTSSGNLRAPDKVTCVEWVKKAWSTVTTDVIVNSFKACGISSSIDGSEDSSIHCLKPSGVAHSALAAIQSATASQNSNSVLDEEDPFADCDMEEDPTTIDDE